MGAVTAVVFVHGLTGGGDTWGKLPTLLRADPDLRSCRIEDPWRYPSRVSFSEVVTRLFWKADPAIKSVGDMLRTYLGTLAPADRLVLVAHSMGGLVVQSFILEELAAGRRSHLDRLAEVVLLGTPSGGLKKAAWVSWFKDQVADMASSGSFITRLREAWRVQIDDRRADRPPPTRFRLTLVAGAEDRFVGAASSQEPFAFDEKETVPGDHVSMIKSADAAQTVYKVLKHRLVRGTPTAAEVEAVEGRDPGVVARVNEVLAAALLQDADELLAIDEALADEAKPMPAAWRALGLALLAQGRHAEAAAWLARYVDFSLDGSLPFAADAEAVQQLAIALSGAGDAPGAVARLRSLDERAFNSPETQGLLAGRLMAEWRRTQKAEVGWSAKKVYENAAALARAAGDDAQLAYNAINAAFLGVALRAGDGPGLASEALAAAGRVIEAKPGGDTPYWMHATRGEALLIQGRFRDAEAAYREALRCAPAPRQRSTTGVQARALIAAMGNPGEAAALRVWLETVSWS